MKENILSLEKARPFIDKWIHSGIEKIKAETGIEYSEKDLYEELIDCEWIFTINVPWETDVYIDIKTAEKAINHIINRNIKYILDERKEF